MLKLFDPFFTGMCIGTKYFGHNSNGFSMIHLQKENPLAVTHLVLQIPDFIKFFPKSNLKYLEAL